MRKARRRLLVANGTGVDNDNQAPIFRIRFSCKGRGWNVIIDGGSVMNAISKEAGDKLQLQMAKHPKRYRVASVDDYPISVNRQCIVPLKLGSYEDNVSVMLFR